MKHYSHFAPAPDTLHAISSRVTRSHRRRSLFFLLSIMIAFGHDPNSPTYINSSPRVTFNEICISTPSLQELGHVPHVSRVFGVLQPDELHCLSIHALDENTIFLATLGAITLEFDLVRIAIPPKAIELDMGKEGHISPPSRAGLTRRAFHLLEILAV